MKFEEKGFLSQGNSRLQSNAVTPHRKKFDPEVFSIKAFKIEDPNNCTQNTPNLSVSPTAKNSPKNTNIPSNCEVKRNLRLGLRNRQSRLLSRVDNPNNASLRTRLRLGRTRNSVGY